MAGIIALVIQVLNAIPMDTGTAGGIGLLVAVPLFLAAMVTVFGGIVLTIIHRDDRGLVALALASTAYFVFAFVDTPSSAVLRAVPVAFGVLAVTLSVDWFFRRRERRPPDRP